jgi:hypothetical protein
MRFVGTGVVFTGSPDRHTQLPRLAGCIRAVDECEPDAEASLGRALTLQPALTHAALLLGELQSRRDRVKDAIGTYQAALIHRPGMRP